VNRRVGLAVIAGLTAALAGVAAAWAAVPITTCGYKITTPGKYELAADLQCPPVGAGIFIAASQVDLDLNGHTISSGEIGIQVTSLGSPDSVVPLSKIKIHGNGLIERFTNGITFANVTDSQVEGVTVAFNAFGIGAYLCNNCDFQANIVTQNVLSGLFLENCDGCEIAQNQVSYGYDPGRNPSGIEVAGSVGVKMHDNAVTGNYVGVRIEDGTTGAQIYNNLIAGNAGFLTTSAGAGAVGIFVSSGNGNDIHDNTVEANSAPGAPSSYDLKDDNTNCGTNNWHDNTFFTANQSCIH
jgi:parallel beta-helix repeat protein